MNAAATQILLDGFLKGGFDIFEALLSVTFSYTAGDSSDLDEEELAKLLGTHTVSMQASIQGGGAVSMLLTMGDVTKLVTQTNNGEAVASDSLDEASMGTLKEIADGVLGGGVANLTERFGEDVDIESYDVVVYTPEQATELLSFIGEGPVLSSFTFDSSPDYDSSGYIIVSSAFEGRVPSSQSNAGDPLVSDDEMKDILSGFSPGDETASYAGGDDSLPENMDIVLGIDLIATARLGKIEMPIAELLELGPGSIIEVGHMVDEPVELLVNGHLIARGDVVVVDEKFGLRITEIISPRERIESFR